MAAKKTQAKPAEKPAEAKPPRKDPRLCKTVGCDRPGIDIFRGLCGAHYASRRGDGA